MGGSFHCYVSSPEGKLYIAIWLVVSNDGKRRPKTARRTKRYEVFVSNIFLFSMISGIILSIDFHIFQDG